MNLFKSLFISAFLVWLVTIALYSCVQMAKGAEPLFSWLGLALASASPLAFFARLFVFKTPQSNGHPVEYSMLSGLGLALTMAMSFRHGLVAGNAHIWAGITLIGWMAYLRWFSKPI